MKKKISKMSVTNINLKEENSQSTSKDKTLNKSSRAISRKSSKSASDTFRSVASKVSKEIKRKNDSKPSETASDQLFIVNASIPNVSFKFYLLI